MIIIIIIIIIVIIIKTIIAKTFCDLKLLDI